MSLLNETIKKIKPVSIESKTAARARLEQLTMPFWALGRVMDLALEIAGMTRTLKPPVSKKCVVIFAGDHGVVDEGVSLYPQEVTPQMVFNFVAGGAGINALSKVTGTDVAVVDMGVKGDLGDLARKGSIISKKIAPGTANMAKGPAMSIEDAQKSVEAGIEVALELGKTVDVFGTGDMGIGNTTPSSAIVACITGKKVDNVAGRGTGIDDDQLIHKINVIKEALKTNKPDSKNGLDVLSKIGGFEIGGIAGLILGAASMSKPVVIDGFISTAGALIANLLEPKSAQYMISAHKSVEPGHKAALDHLGKNPLLDLDMRLGEGTGGALAMAVVDAAVGVLTEVATFEEAGVSEAE